MATHIEQEVARYQHERKQEQLLAVELTRREATIVSDSLWAVIGEGIPPDGDYIACYELADIFGEVGSNV